MKTGLRVTAAAALLVSTLLIASTAVAAPNNKNTVTFPVTCEGLGSFNVTSVGDNSGVVFGPDGQVIVAKRIVGAGSFTIAIEGGPTIGPIPEEFEGGAKGSGFEDRLIECSFTQTFEEEFTLTRRDVRMLELGEEWIGATATASGTFTGTAWVIMPGQ